MSDRIERSIVLATEHWGPELVTVARGADARGFARLWTTERPGRDALLRAAEVIMSTGQIGVGTGIAFAFTRSPVAMAGSVSELQRLSGGRFVLGLGTGTRGVRSRWYGESFDHPAPRLAEYADLVRQLLMPRDGALAFAGDYYDVEVPSFEVSFSGGGVPVYGSGLNPIMLKWMARRCNGVAIHPLAGAPAYLEAVAGPALAEGRGQAAGPVRLALWLLVSISDDAVAAEAAARRQLAFYFCTPSYRTVAEVCGWGPETEKLREEFKRTGPDWNKIGELVPEPMIEALCPAGSPSSVAAQVRDRMALLERYGIDEVVFEPAVMGSGLEETIAAFRHTVDTFGE